MLVLQHRAHHQLLVAEVPEGRHVEGHVGEDHHVLQESKDGVHCWEEAQRVRGQRWGPAAAPQPAAPLFTSRSAVPVVVEIDTDGNGEGDEGDEEEQLFPLVGFALLGENNEGTAQLSARPNGGCNPNPSPTAMGPRAPGLGGCGEPTVQEHSGDGGTAPTNPTRLPCLCLSGRGTSPSVCWFT